MTLSNLIKLIRPAQWVKNGFIFLPLFFGGRLLDWYAWSQVLIAFVSFSAMASAVYCFNDLTDASADAAHSVKRMRPVASGALRRVTAGYICVTLCVVSLLISCLCLRQSAAEVTAVMLLYMVLNLAYSLWLKHVAILDVIVIALGFVLRVLVGGMAGQIELSPWIMLMTFLLALFMAFAKRRADFVLSDSAGHEMRRSVRGYTLPFMNIVLGFLASVTVVCYLMYTVSPEVMARLDCRYVYVSALFVFAGVLRYLQLSIVDSRTGDPTSVVLHDRFILMCVGCWVLFFVLILY